MSTENRDFRGDARWQLIERIAASSSFQKSARLRDLLRYMAEQSLEGRAEELNEHRIGCAVFGKPQDYSVTEDSSVRVHVRQLRLRLHEYFDGEGRSEAALVEIPKGSYTVIFRSAEKEQPAAAVPAYTHPVTVPRWLWFTPWVLAGVLLAALAGLLLYRPAAPAAAPAPWPLSTLFAGDRPVQVVVADVNYGMTRLINEKPVTLDEYLSPSYRSGLEASYPHPTVREARSMKYLSDSLLTSYADLVVTTSLLRLSGSSASQLVVRAARELRPRDLESGSAVFIGSPSSNPWVFYYQDKLNFQEREGVVGQSLKYFANLHPRAGEQAEYRGLTFTGSSGEDYATISLLPASNGQGSVYIIQGLQQEGTEAAGLFLSDPANRNKLAEALGVKGTPSQPVYFEALLRTQSVAGAPNTTSIIATRLIRP